MLKLTYFSHDAFLLQNADTKLIFDPFLTGNPNAVITPEEIKTDYVLLTHGHGDHLGDGIAIASDNDAMIIAPYELAIYCGKQGCKVHPMHIGGSYQFPFGRVKLTIAHHGSGADLGDGALSYMGNPCGFLVTIGDKTIYHAGDTGLFMDMKLIGAMNEIDIALLPIGDNFTMGIDDAVKAVEFLQPELTVPMHYQTFDVINTDPELFVEKVQNMGLNAMVLDYGQTIEF